MGKTKQNVIFPIAQLPPIPTRSYTGNKIKSAVVKALAEQADAERAASNALDRLIDVVRKFEGNLT